MPRRFKTRRNWTQSNLILGAIAILLLTTIAIVANYTGGVAIELGGLEMSLSAKTDGNIQLVFVQAI